MRATSRRAGTKLRKDSTIWNGVKGKDFHRFSRRNPGGLGLEPYGGTLADHELDADGLPAWDVGMDRKAGVDRIWKQIWLLYGAAVMLIVSIVILCFQRHL